MDEKEFYELHRSEAIKVLLSKRNHLSYYSNLALAEALEEEFPEKNRLYVVKEDHLPLEGNTLTAETF